MVGSILGLCCFYAIMVLLTLKTATHYGVSVTDLYDQHNLWLLTLLNYNAMNLSCTNVKSEPCTTGILRNLKGSICRLFVPYLVSCCRIASSTWTFQTAYSTSIKSIFINSKVQQIGHIICIEHHFPWCLLYRGIKVGQRNDTIKAWSGQFQYLQFQTMDVQTWVAEPPSDFLLTCKIVFFRLEGQAFIRISLCR